MSLDSVTYLLTVYWPYMAGILAIGVGVGWVSGASKR